MTLVVGNTFIQTLTGNTSAGTGTFTTAAFGANTSTGNSIIITVGDDAGAINKISTITDSAGNTYTQATTVASTDSLSVWHCLGIKGGSSVTITVTYLSVSITNVSITAQEFQGLLYPAAADQAASTTGTSTTPTSAVSGFPAKERELVIGAVCYAAAGSTAALGTGYTNLGNETTNVTIHSAQESKVIGTSATQTASFTITSAAWLCAVVTYYGIAPSVRVNSLRPHPFSPGLAR